ncbi:MAG: dihydroorotate dehydrogenase-like protein [Alphaproteobacteria bacterium]|nr:dihydroorotate dehydrogenase-like protein [Alphaproteobacteria bacterium]
MDLSTPFMGMRIRNPLVVGASPLSDDLDACRRLEDAGVGAIVMRSLFMEQIERERQALMDHADDVHDAHAEALSYLPPTAFGAGGPNAYLEQVRRLKQAVSVPVVASLNGIAVGAWVRYASLLEEAGADGLELNVYYLPLDGAESADEVEQRHLGVLRAVKERVRVPVAMKLTHFFSSPVHLARRLEAAGADGLVLFAPLFHTDIDPEALEIVPALHHSDPGVLHARLMWLAAMFGRVELPLTLSGGASSHLDVIKAVMSGASAVQMTTALLRHGPDHAARLLAALGEWLEEHEYTSLDQMRGSMSLLRCPDPEALERANYIQVLQRWRPH